MSKVAAIACGVAMSIFTIGCSEKLVSNVQPDAESQIAETTSNDFKPYKFGQANTKASQTQVQNGCLVFDNIEQLEKALKEVLMMTPETRNQFYANLGGFVSLNALHEQALDECSTFDTFEQYETARQKHSKSFIFDPNGEDLTPHLRIKNPFYAYILNVNGEAVVGGKVVNFNEITSYEQTSAYQASQSAAISKGQVIQTNHIHVYDGKRKMWADAHPVDNAVYIKLQCQVKSFWGWNIYREHYHIYVVGLKGYDGIFERDHSWYGNMNLDSHYDTGMVPNGFLCLFGFRQFNMNGSQITGIRHATAQLTIYSRDMGSMKSGCLTINTRYTPFIRPQL